MHFFVGVAVFLLDVGVEVVYDFLVVLLNALKDQQCWNYHEDFGVSLLQLLLKLGVFVGCRLNHLREVQQLRQLLVVHEVGEALAPGVLELAQTVHEFQIIFELRVHHLNILVIFA